MSLLILITPAPPLPPIKRRSTPLVLLLNEITWSKRWTFSSVFNRKNLSNTTCLKNASFSFVSSSCDLVVSSSDNSIFSPFSIPFKVPRRLRNLPVTICSTTDFHSVIHSSSVIFIRLSTFWAISSEILVTLFSMLSSRLARNRDCASAIVILSPDRDVKRNGYPSNKILLPNFMFLNNTLGFCNFKTFSQYFT